MSGPGCQVNRVGTPPLTGTTYTSVLPSYWALKAISEPSGENAGFVSTPESLVNRRTFLPLRSATHKSPAYTNAMLLLLIAGWLSSRVSLTSGPFTRAAGAVMGDR